MNEMLNRRRYFYTIGKALVVAACVGCGGNTPTIPSTLVTKLKKTGKIVVVIIKKLVPIVRVLIDLIKLTVNIETIVDGKEEMIKIPITTEDADILRNGGNLVIRDEHGTEIPVNYKIK